jgi:hypothetical protein
MAKSNLIDVSIIFGKGSATLVEFTDPEGNPVRKSVPTESVIPYGDDTRAKISLSDFELGISYGIPFEYRLREHTVTPMDVANALHRNGIWISEDILRNQQAVISSLMSAFGISLSDLLALANEFSKKEK